MTLREALSWCKDHCAEISFRREPGRSFVRIQQSESMYVDDEDLAAGVERLRQLVRRSETKSQGDNTPLERLTFEDRNCRGRLLRLARAIGAGTVGELLTWAETQPRDLYKIMDYRNIGERSLMNLIDALREHGVERIPLGDVEGDSKSEG